MPKLGSLDPDRSHFYDFFFFLIDEKFCVCVCPLLDISTCLMSIPEDENLLPVTHYRRLIKERKSKRDNKEDSKNEAESFSIGSKTFSGGIGT